MNQIEKDYVLNTYEQIASSFSQTRYSYWTGVKNFLENIQSLPESNDQVNLLDYGCGNGKYFPLCEKYNLIGFDNCEGLLKIVSKKYPGIKLIHGDVSKPIELYPNLESDSFDFIISIAVIHHLSLESSRIQMLSNIIQMLKSGGQALITGWATTAIDKKKFVKLNNYFESDNKYLDSDYLVGWDNKYSRYYHFFEPDELEYLISKSNYSNEIFIKKIFFEQNNWFWVIQKI